MSYLPYSLGRVLSYTYLLRFPLLTAVAIVGLSVGAFLSGTRTLGGSIFDIDWAWGMFFASWTAFLSGLVVMRTSRIVLLYGRQRFFDGASPANNSVLLLVRRCVVVALPISLMLLVTLPVVGVAVYTSTHLRTGHEMIEVALGFFATLLCLLIVFLVRRIAFYLFGRSSDARTRARSTSQPLAQRFTRSPRFRQISWDTGRGYLKYKDGEAVSILPRHIAAAVLLILTLLLYAVIGDTASQAELREQS
jgi:hypothetical protein